MYFINNLDVTEYDPSVSLVQVIQVMALIVQSKAFYSNPHTFQKPDVIKVLIFLYRGKAIQNDKDLPRFEWLLE